VAELAKEQREEAPDAIGAQTKADTGEGFAFIHD